MSQRRDTQTCRLPYDRVRSGSQWGYWDAGYSVWCNPRVPDEEPWFFDYACDHAYIETECLGNAEYSIEPPILCESLVCTYGWKLLLSSVLIHASTIPIAHGNASLAVQTVAAIILQCPLFTVGHNIFGVGSYIAA